MITFFATEVAGAFATSSFAGTIGLSCINFTLIVGAENVKFLALSVIQPFFSVTNSEATSWVEPSLERTETLALIGALENP